MNRERKERSSKCLSRLQRRPPKRSRLLLGHCQKCTKRSKMFFYPASMSFTALASILFARLANKFETRFSEDMERLNVLTPDVVTRVSEYVEQVISFIEKIISNGFDYTSSDGSVYFD